MRDDPGNRRTSSEVLLNIKALMQTPRAAQKKHPDNELPADAVKKFAKADHCTPHARCPDVVRTS